MKKVISLFAFLSLSMMLITALADVKVEMQVMGDEINQLVSFQVKTEVEEETAVAAALQAQIDERFMQNDSFKIFARSIGREKDSVIFEKGNVYEGQEMTSLILTWDGQQKDGYRASVPISMCFHPETGEAISLRQLFLDGDRAIARLEEIIEADIVPLVSDYLEYAELLPIPEDCFFLDAFGLTIYYDDEHYRTFAGTCGAVNVAWYEIADLLDPDGPAAQFIEIKADAEQLKAVLESGHLGTYFQIALGENLGTVLERYPLLADPDFTVNSRLYQMEPATLRGVSVEIPKYTDTPEMMTGITAIRSTRMDLFGLKTSWTGREDIVALLGEPQAELTYDEQQAEDMMLPPGVSLVYPMGKYFFELHLDEEGLLSVLILRTSMPE